MVAAVVAVALAGCSNDADDGDADDGAADDGTEPTEASAATSGSSVAPSDDESAGSTSGSTTDGLERATFDGVTFTYDPDVIESVEPVETDPEGSAPDATSNAAGDVRSPTRAELTFVGGGDGELAITTVAPTSEGTTDLPDPPEASSDDELRFRNGTGTRASDPAADPAYSFVGMTSDLAATVQLTAGGGETDHGVVTAALDALVASLFVDTAFGWGSDAGCADDYEFVRHVTIPEGTMVEPGDELTKTWRIRNVGECEWDERWSWAFTGGDPLTVLSTSSLAGVGPGEELDVDVRLRVPDEEGVWAAQWQPIGPGSPEPVGPPTIILVETSS